MEMPALPSTEVDVQSRVISIGSQWSIAKKYCRPSTGGSFDCDGDLVSERHGDGIADHLISVVNFGINELKLVGESLNACDLSNGHSTIEMFTAFDEAANIFADEDHFWCLRVKLTVAPRRLHGESLLVPCLHSIAAHENRRECADEVFVTVDHPSVVEIAIDGRHGGELQIPNDIAECQFFCIIDGRADREFEIDIEIVAKTDVENALAFLSDAVILRVNKGE